MRKNNKHTPESKFRHDLGLCSRKKNLSAAISLYESSLSKKIRLDHYHFNAFLYICSEAMKDSSKTASAFEFGFRVFDHMLSSEITPTEATITAVARPAAAVGDGDGPSSLLKPWERVSAEEPVIAALLKVSVETGRGDRVYEYLHKLRETVRCVSESTADIIETWFGAAVAEEVGVEEWESERVQEKVLRNGGGWHGVGWLGKGRWDVRRVNVDVGGGCLYCGEQLGCVDIDIDETEKFAQAIAGLAMEREVQFNFKEFQVGNM
ncbi:hypothetical protein Vadar_033813 [Vaccinium darrowii]|uniref:Uncharacterized protein n=1 Tax=Vaccinium darrowii TaxID=229202 RepID=A0ACB7XEF3_9ERIC|nr:hypothetical protein Vadar_033813 [Vaccinium darrowii]